MGNLRLLTSLRTAQPYRNNAPSSTFEVWAWEQSLHILVIQGEHTERLRLGRFLVQALLMGEAEQATRSAMILPRQAQSKESSAPSGRKDSGENENSVKKLDGARRSKALKNNLNNNICPSKSVRAVMSTLSCSCCHTQARGAP